jgi:hypothetical protein
MFLGGLDWPEEQRHSRKSRACQASEPLVPITVTITGGSANKAWIFLGWAASNEKTVPCMSLSAPAGFSDFFSWQTLTVMTACLILLAGSSLPCTPESHGNPTVLIRDSPSTRQTHLDSALEAQSGKHVLLWPRCDLPRHADSRFRLQNFICVPRSLAAIASFLNGWAAVFIYLWGRRLKVRVSPSLFHFHSSVSRLHHFSGLFGSEVCLA